MTCYTVSLRAATERAAVAAARAQIARDTTEMRLLRAELRTRSRLPELQRWNEQVLALAPPSAEQLMVSPVMLAAYAGHGGAVVPAPAAAAPVAVATVVRDAPLSAPLLHRASFTARGPNLGADAALIGTAAAPLAKHFAAGFTKAALR